MAITKSIVDAMGGKISVKSSPGRGSRFTVSLSFKLCEVVKCEAEKNVLEDIPRSLKAGMNAHISKPLNMEELFEIVGKTVRKMEL